MVSTMWTGMRMVRDWSAKRAGDSLAYPPRRVGRELVALLPVEFIDGAEEAEVPFLDEVEEREVGRAADVFLRDRNDEAEVAAREDVARLGVALLDALRELALFGGGQERVLADLAQINLDGVVAGRLRGL